jgi:23S rRNA (adenine2503-C2)-methyltransferase
MMELLETAGREDLAVVYVARTEAGKTLEFVEALVPPYPREEKWVLIVSSLYGCPVGCLICDSGLHYDGKVSESDLLAQIDFLVTRRFPSLNVRTNKLKVHFARMGDPAFNPNVNKVLARLKERYMTSNLMPCISTVAPLGTDPFFEELLEVKRTCYPEGNFQLQFSIHTTDPPSRNELIPVPKWSFSRIARYGEAFLSGTRGERKVTLNFAASTRYPLEPSVVGNYFDPETFLIKITPLNPSQSTRCNGLDTLVTLNPQDLRNRELVAGFEELGYDVILSIGEPEENCIKSNCGLRVMTIEQKVPVAKR